MLTLPVKVRLSPVATSALVPRRPKKLKHLLLNNHKNDRDYRVDWSLDRVTL